MSILMLMTNPIDTLTIELALYSAKTARDRAVEALCSHMDNLARHAGNVQHSPTAFSDLGTLTVYLQRAEGAKADIAKQDAVIENLMVTITCLREAGIVIADRYADRYPNLSENAK